MWPAIPPLQAGLAERRLLLLLRAACAHQLWCPALQVIMTNSYHGMNIILLNRGYSTITQTINIPNSPNSAYYWGSWSNGQQRVLQVRCRPASLFLSRHSAS